MFSIDTARERESESMRRKERRERESMRRKERRERV